jgi:HK97 family phage portal protein
MRSWFGTKLSPILGGGRGWYPIVRESFPGAWQQNIEVRADMVFAQATVFACMTLIAADIGKLRLKLREQDKQTRLWEEVTGSPLSPVLRKPNAYQTRQKFLEHWLLSKLGWGNTYGLKERDARMVVTAIHILDPNRTKPLVAPDGSVFYQLQADELAGITPEEEGLIVPASEIIHDRMWCLFHPLVGLSPLYANGLAAWNALKMQTHSAAFFANRAMPSGILTAPAQISDETAKRAKEYWEREFAPGAQNAGKVAVLGDGLRYEAMVMKSTDAQLVEQMKWSAEQICAVFHVPAFKVGAGPVPSGQKVEDLNTIYYTDCLQSLIESVEASLDEGLGLTDPAGQGGRTYGTYLELDDLLRMDSATMAATLSAEMKAGYLSPNEARAKKNLAPVTGGDSPMLQQQNFSLEALAKRDSQADPFKTAPPPAPPPEPEPEEEEEDAEDAAEKGFRAEYRAAQSLRRALEATA